MAEPSNDNEQVIVDADPEAVRAVLREGLSLEQFASISVSAGGNQSDNPLASEKRGLDPSVVYEVAQFAVLSIAGNATYEVMKSATALLIKKFGKQSVEIITSEK